MRVYGHEVLGQLHEAPLVFVGRYLPPYSLDLNPVELLWANLKRLLRSAAARSLEAIYKALGQAIAAITENDCLSWFMHCG